MPSFLSSAFFFLFLSSSILATVALPINFRRSGLQARKNKGFTIPFQRTHPSRTTTGQRRDDVTGSIGLGDNSDLLYSVPVQIGNTTVAVNLDTGSSDLWVITEQCTTGTCNRSTAARYDTNSSTSKDTGIPVVMRYGDSTTGTQASGTVMYDTASVAGVTVANQSFAAVNATTNSLPVYGISGIFGLGFPDGSQIQNAAVPVGASGTDEFVSSTFTQGPLLSRIVMSNDLEMPMFTITLQRNTIDISGGGGMLTVGALPDGVDNSSLTWVPVRLYAPADGGLTPPSFARDEIYPFRWEVDIDGVFLDGQRLPESTIPANNGVNASTTSALIDTGNSLLRGPRDVVNKIFQTVSPTYNPALPSSTPIVPCSVPHTLAFQIGGKLFPVDPLDFIGQNSPGDTADCVASKIVSTDPPSFGALFRWSLGDPFMKSNLVAFHYGNLTNPSADPPRIGFLSLVPTNATSEFAQALSDAKANGGTFEATIEQAPTTSAAALAEVTVTPEPYDLTASTTVVGSTTSAPEPQETVDANSEPEPSTSSTPSKHGNGAPSSIPKLTLAHGVVWGLALMLTLI